MAFKRSSRNVAIKGLGQIVGLLLSLYVFDQVLDAIWTTINASTFFGTAVSFAEDLLPVVGILGIFYVIYGILAQMGMV